MRDQFIVLRNGRVEALDDDKRPAPTLWSVSSDEAKTVCCPLAEARLVRAYLALFLLPWTEGAKAVRLARFGVYEVRLVEIAHDPAADGFPMWLELYAHDVRMSLDSCGCEAFDDAVSAAAELIERASVLHLLRRG